MSNYASVASVAAIAAYFNRYAPVGVRFEAEPTPPQFGTHGTLWIRVDGLMAEAVESESKRLFRFARNFLREVERRGA